MVMLTKASLAANESASFTLVVSADCGTLDGTVINNTATVAGARPDPNSAFALTGADALRAQNGQRGEVAAAGAGLPPRLVKVDRK